MSSRTRRLFEFLKERVKAVPGEVGAEARRMGTQGSMELASALFHGSNAFVPYGPGQYTPQPDRPAPGGTEPENAGPQHERERGGPER